MAFAKKNGSIIVYDAAYALPGKLYAAGVKFALSTYDASSARTLPFEIATAVPAPNVVALKRSRTMSCE